MARSLSIRLPDNLRSELEELSLDQKVSVSDLVREALSGFVAVRRFRALRDRVLPFAEAQGLLTDEDVFKAIS